MHMEFYFDYKVDEFLFDNLTTSTIGGFIALLIVVGVVTCFGDIMKIVLAHAKLYSSVLRTARHPKCISESTQFIVDDNIRISRRKTWFFIEILLYTIEVTFAYVIMLIAMSYNFYVFLVVVLSSGLTYYVFGNKFNEIRLKTKKMKLPCDHCHPTYRRNAEENSESLSDFETPSTSNHDNHATTEMTDDKNDSNTDDCCHVETGRINPWSTLTPPLQTISAVLVCDNNKEEPTSCCSENKEGHI